MSTIREILNIGKGNGLITTEGDDDGYGDSNVDDN